MDLKKVCNICLNNDDNLKGDNGCIVMFGSLSSNLRMQYHALSWASSFDPAILTSRNTGSSNNAPINGSKWSKWKNRCFNSHKDVKIWNKIYVLSTDSDDLCNDLQKAKSLGTSLIFNDIFDIGVLFKYCFFFGALNNMLFKLDISNKDASQNMLPRFKVTALTLLVKMALMTLLLLTRIAKTVYITLRYLIALWSIPRLKCIIVMSPPCFPLLLVCIFVSFIRGVRVIVDVHNYFTSVLIPESDSLNISTSKSLAEILLGFVHMLKGIVLKIISHFLLKFEGWCYSRCNVILAVSDHMSKDIKNIWNLDAVVYKDRPSHEHTIFDDLEKHIYYHKYLSSICEPKTYVDGYEKNMEALSTTLATVDPLMSKLIKYLKKATKRNELFTLTYSPLPASDFKVREDVESTPSILDGVYTHRCKYSKGVWDATEFTEDSTSTTSLALFIDKTSALYMLLKKRLNLLNNTESDDIKYVEETLFGTLIIHSNNNFKHSLLTKFNNMEGILIIYKRKKNRPAIGITSTSFSQDEDMGMLFHAAKFYDENVDKIVTSKRFSISSYFPPLFILVTGDGINKFQFVQMASQLKLNYTLIHFLFVPTSDYYNITAIADFGISMHVSYSKVDLPMKVVHMQGCGLPVLAYNYKSIVELVQHRHNGGLFTNSKELAHLLLDLLLGFPYNYDSLMIKSKLSRKYTLVLDKPKIGAINTFRSIPNHECSQIIDEGTNPTLTEIAINSRNSLIHDCITEWNHKVKANLYPPQ